MGILYNFIIVCLFRGKVNLKLLKKYVRNLFNFAANVKGVKDIKANP